jgi:hypothetical protein
LAEKYLISVMVIPYPWYKAIGFGERLVLRKLYGTFHGHHLEIRDEIERMGWFTIWWFAGPALLSTKITVVVLDDNKELLHRESFFAFASCQRISRTLALIEGL